ncbi:FxSxx-COOH system tetratricopeptide repeat protein [Streptomyces sp. SAS_270]|uniref:FxSxx-COOH system tetratricopeptide repeat protein n=1 Tax=Streptomyces sp. SAS_270 TaxID=3412748 RepID=UPI00403D54CD
MTGPTDDPASLPSWLELMDAMYLAACQDAASPSPGPRPCEEAPPPGPNGDTVWRHVDAMPLVPIGPPNAEPGRRPGSTVGPGQAGRDPGEGQAGSGTWPTPEQLPGSLALGRALRPLRLRRPAPNTWEMDEEQTAEQAASDGLWLPVRRPIDERRLDLWLIVDDSPSMALWQDVVRMLQALMEHTAAFRKIWTSRLDIAAAGPAARRRGDAIGRRGRLQPGPDCLVLVVTDGMASAWRDDDAAAFLYTTARASPTAVLSLLPQELWEFTVPSAVRARLSVPQAAVPNRLFRLLRTGNSVSGLSTPPPSRSGRAVPVPILELTPRSLGRWARLVASPGGRHDTAVLLAGRGRDLGAHTSLYSLTTRPAPSPEARSLKTGLAPGNTSSPAQEAVARFIATASPTAFALARRLAAAPLNLPVMRLIQHSMPGAQAWNLAEIMLFGLLQRTDDGAVESVEAVDQVSFDFADGVREELLGLGTRAETMGVLRQVSNHLAPRLASSMPGGDLLVNWRADAADPPVDDRTRPFVRPLHAALCALSGPYLKRAVQLKRLLHEPGQTLLPSSPAPRATDDERSATVCATSSPLLSPGGSVSTPSQPAAPPPRLWGNVPQRNRNFTGREDLLTQLRQRLATGVTTAVLPEALHGMGGVGKSQIAIEYVYRSSKDYQLIWWIPAEQTNLIVQSLIELGDQMGLRAGADRAAVPAVLEALRVGEPYANWLLVFDNAENPHEVRQFFPKDGPGRVMVTSRNSQWSSLASSLEVDVFAREESITLIKRRSPEIAEDAADRLADALGDLPLAVEQAAVWLAETGMPVHQYLDLFETKYTDLLRVDPPADYDLPVAAAWNVSLDRLREDHPAALQLLQVCAFFAPEPIDWDFFSAVRGVAAPSALRAALDDPIKLARAVREVGRYALARLDHRRSTIQVHRLVQRVLIEQMNGHERAEMRHCAHEILANADPRNPQRSSEWPRYSALLPHARASRMVECEDPWVRELVLNETRFLLARSDYAEALPVAEEAAGMWRRLLGDDHEHVISADQVRALALRWQNRYAEAYSLQSELVTRCRRVLGERDEATQRALSVLAILLRLRGDFYRARELDQQAYETTLREYGADDVGTLQTAHNYAVSLRLAGDFEEAYRLDEEIYERRVEVIGDDHLQTLNSLHSLYIDLQELGRYQEALEGQERLRDLMLGMLGEEHSLTIWVSRELSVTRRKVGDHQGALELSSKVLEVLRRRSADESLENVRAALNHATDLRHANDLTAAVELGRQTLARCRRLLGEEHPHSYAAAVNLAVPLRLLGQVNEAHELDEEAVNGLSRCLDANHPRTLLARTNLASDLSELGEIRQACELDRTLQRVSAERRGENHPATLAITLNLSYDLKALGETTEATGLYNTALAAYRTVLGPDHQATRDAMSSMRANRDIDLLSI